MHSPYRFLLFLPIMLLYCESARGQFTDDFADGNFTADPAWAGNDAFFTVDNGMLRSNTGTLAAATTYYLSTASSQAAGQWEFYFNLKFATSGANYVDVYLMSDVQDLSAPANGYFVRIGETADHVTLNKMAAGSPSTLVASPDGIVNSSTDNPFRIKVTRDAANNWTLHYDDGVTGNYVSAGNATDASITSSAWFGIRITQSTAATAVNNHFFDDFYVGPIVQDTTPPSIASATIIDELHVDLLFNEAVEQSSAESIVNYGLIPFNGIAAASLDGMNPALVHLTLNGPMANLNTYTLTVNGVEDLAGNAISNGQVQFTYTVFSTAQPGDVVINELMPDPDPPVGLPNAEYVELFNATADRAFDLTGWKITDGSSTGTLPAAQLPPGGFVILTSTANAALFNGFGTVLGVPSFPSLNNDGDPMQLWDASNMAIDAVTYSSGWYNDAVKANGGWSLERKDPFTPCSSAANWTASTAATGGTPGGQNSVFAILQDTVPPLLVQAFVLDSVTLDLLFNEPMDQAGLLSGTYSIDPVLGIANIAVVAPDRVRLTLSAPLIEGVVHTVTATDVNDCPGNPIGAGNTATFALPQPISKGDVVINEVLYDPRGSGSDFVELYNRSQKVVSLAGLKFANGSGSVQPITPDAYLLRPGQYVAVATNVSNVLTNYPLGRADRMLQATLPSYNNGSGTVIFLGAAGDTLDLFNYSDALHFALLKSVDGVSLERVDPDRPTADNSNWHSAAADVNFATPGYQNSQYAPAPAARGEITIDPAIFSPDNDGYQDLLTIVYRFDEPGFVATMKVFDIAGREVRTLMNNVLLGTSGAVSWDGLMDGHELARIGPYILYMEAYDLAGNVEKFRKTVVLAHRL
ncbi:MAG TPA: lamin tail domain-containing protein [Flavobacteriales bacterium]|nr:lamin tail domain-containing protein [Flavobacteriales bacterium]HRO39512.1 lamin tail domain-containing protein [Flavobacteriales bacterium]HRP81914.1 lamin tail domain-containing protein [Flavobacteriales bacterium]HRQ83954.1 lamin tail domain-containing protein [Flavobacteriales bacterium]